MSPTHVVSQGLAQELKNAGWPQEGSEFYWVKVYPYSLVLPGPSWQAMHHGQLVNYKEGDYLFCAAPIASELMERMPPEVALNRYEDEGTKNWVAVHHVEGDWSKYTGLEEADTAPDALAKLCVHLIKEGKMKL